MEVRMVKKITATTLGALLLLTVSLTKSTPAASRDKVDLKRTSQVKAGIAKLGLGEDARVAVKLRNKKLLGGYISQAGEETFVLTDLKTGESTTIQYADD